MVLRVKQELRGTQDCRALLGYGDQQVSRVTQDLREIPDLKERPAHRERPELKDTLDCKELQV